MLFKNDNNDNIQNIQMFLSINVLHNVLKLDFWAFSEREEYLLLKLVGNQK